MTDVTLPPSSPTAPNPNVIEGVDGHSAGSTISSSDPFAAAPVSTSTTANNSTQNPPRPMTLEGMGLYTTPQIVPSTPNDQTPSIADFPNISSESARSETQSTTPVVQHTSSKIVELPTIEQMQTSLEQSGALMAGVEVAEQATATITSPLASLQPERIKQVGEVSLQTPQITAPVLTPLPAFNPLPIETAPVPGAYSRAEVTVEGPSLPIWLLFVALLIGQIMIGMLQVLHTILVKFPLVQQLIASNQMGPEQLHLYPLKALSIGGLVVISGLLAGLIIIKAEARRNMIIILGAAGLVVANIITQNFFGPPEIISGNPLKISQIISELQQNR